MPASRSVVSMLLRGWETFLYTSRPDLRAAFGRAPARQRPDGDRGAGLTLHPAGSRAVPF
jgi:hypothetical protein